MVQQCCVNSASIYGVEAVPVTVEISIGNGIPGMSIVGMGDTAIHEAKERVKAAIRSTGFFMPREKIVVNLAPGGIPKMGAGFDLPIAVGILAATKQIDPEIVKNNLFVGEVSLHGDVKCVSGDLAYCICASRFGMDYVSAKRLKAPVNGIEQLCIENLSSLHSHDALSSAFGDIPENMQQILDLDFSDVSGHECAKRAIQLAVAGKHGLLMVGPPGSGKTMLASRIPSIMPELVHHDALETAAIHSIAGEGIEKILKGVPPFRHPHHSATTAGLLGGGTPIRPGEVSLAHNGVLFLDELAEFKPATLQGLRQPIEQGSISLTRASGKITMPSRFILFASTNPCPCGYYGDDEHQCSCSYPMVKKYLSRIGGPLIDRFDMQLDIHRIPSEDFFKKGSGSSSADLREGVLKCREFRDWRIKVSRTSNGNSEGCKSETTPFEDVVLEDSAKKLAISLAEMSKMSGRAIKSMLNVSRTIADMEEKEEVLAEHIAEAHAYRMSEIIGGE